MNNEAKSLYLQDLHRNLQLLCIVVSYTITFAATLFLASFFDDFTLRMIFCFFFPFFTHKQCISFVTLFAHEQLTKAIKQRLNSIIQKDKTKKIIEFGNKVNDKHFEYVLYEDDVYSSSSKCVPFFEEFSLIDLNLCDIDYIYHDGVYYISNESLEEQEDEN